jgi:hypothetical protein
MILEIFSSAENIGLKNWLFRLKMQSFIKTKWPGCNFMAETGEKCLRLRS